MTFAEAEKMWTTSRKRKLANNTYLVKTGPDSYGVRLHFTEVVELHRNGRVVLDSGAGTRSRQRTESISLPQVSTYIRKNSSGISAII